MIKLHTAEISA